MRRSYCTNGTAARNTAIGTQGTCTDEAHNKTNRERLRVRDPAPLPPPDQQDEDPNVRDVQEASRREGESLARSQRCEGARQLTGLRRLPQPSTVQGYCKKLRGKLKARLTLLCAELAKLGGTAGAGAVR